MNDGNWISYLRQEERAKGIGLALLALGVFYAPSGGVGAEYAYLPMLGYLLLLGGLGLGHMWNFMSQYKGWRNPTRCLLVSGVLAAVLAVPLCGASVLFALSFFFCAQIYWLFLERDRQADALLFAQEIVQAREQDRLAREAKQGRNKKTEPGSV